MNQDNLAMYRSLPNPGYLTPQEKDFDILDLCLSIWKSRRAVVVALLVVTLLFWGGWMLNFLTKPNRSSYSLPVQLTFAGIEKQQYPNGTSFKLSDIIAPSVLRQVHNKLNLHEYSMTPQKLMSLISIAPYIHDEKLIDKKYRFLLLEGEKDLTPQELDELREEKKQEKSDASNRSAMLYFNTLATEVTLPEHIIKQILLTIPQQWAEFRVEKLGVLDLDLIIYSDKIFDRELMSQLDYPILFEYLSDRVTLIKNSISALSEVPNANLSSHKQDEYSLAELQKLMDDIEVFKLNPLREPILSLGVSRDRDSKKTTIYYYENKLQSLLLMRNMLANKAEVALKTFGNYTSGNTPMPQQGGKGLAKNNGKLSENTSIAQFSDGFLDRIIDMSSESSDVKYRQQLMSQTMSLENQSIELEAQIKTTERIIKALKNTDRAKAELRRVYTAKADGLIAEVVTELSSLTEKLKLTANRLSTRNLGLDGLMYTVLSTKLKQTNWHNENRLNLVLMYILLMIVTTFIVIPAAMIARGLKKRALERHAETIDMENE